MEYRFLNLVQFEHARKIGQVFDHAWAKERIVGALPRWGVVYISVELIEALMASETELRKRSGAARMGGLLCPTVEPYGDGKWIVTHATPTGRTSWKVFPGGTVEFAIHRKNQSGIIIGEYTEVLRGRKEVKFTWIDRRRDMVCARHVKAVEELLWAFFSTTYEIDAFLGELRSLAIPD